MIRRINLFGGPGIGKSTLAARLFTSLKEWGLNAELVQEWIKPWAYEGRPCRGFEQYFVSANQVHQEEQYLLNGVDLVVTDSPLWLNLFYGVRHHVPGVDHYQAILHAFDEQYPALNILLERTFPYNSEGRYENDWEAKRIDSDLGFFLRVWNVPCEAVSPADTGKLIHIVRQAIYKNEEVPSGK